MAAVHAAEIWAVGVAVGVILVHDTANGEVATAAAGGWGGEGEDGVHDGVCCGDGYFEGKKQ